MNPYGVWVRRWGMLTAASDLGSPLVSSIALSETQDVTDRDLGR